MIRREYPDAPLVGVGAVVIHAGQVLLVRRGREPAKGRWSLPGGLLELGESLLRAVVREVREETGLVVEPVELIELVERIHTDDERIRYHYVIADYLCRVATGELCAGSDADSAIWVSAGPGFDPDLELDALTIRVIEKAWARSLKEEM